MRAVIDTNVLFSALYDPSSVPGQIIELAIEGGVELFAPESVREELARNLTEKLAYNEEELSETLGALPVHWLEHALYEEHLDVAERAIEDPTDVPLVAAALLVDAGVVSGDGDFHPLVDPVVPTWRPR